MSVIYTSHYVEAVTHRHTTGAIFTVEDKDSHVRCCAVDKLTDQAVLVKIAMKDKAY